MKGDMLSAWATVPLVICALWLPGTSKVLNPSPETGGNVSLGWTASQVESVRFHSADCPRRMRQRSAIQLDSRKLSDSEPDHKVVVTKRQQS